MKDPMIVSITGHRPDKLGGYKIPNPTYSSVINGLNLAFDKLNPDFVITGMALGVDQWAAELCIKRNIKFIAAVPFQGQESRWPEHAQMKYFEILKRAHVTYCINPGSYSAMKMHLRNKWMVDSSDVLAAVWNGTSGGTASCISYAKTVNKKIFWVNFDGAQNKPIEVEVPKIVFETPPEPKVIIEKGKKEEFKKVEASKFLETVKKKAKQQVEEFKEKLLKTQKDKKNRPEDMNHFDVSKLIDKLESAGVSIEDIKKLTMSDIAQSNKKTTTKKSKEAHGYGRVIDIDD